MYVNEFLKYLSRVRDKNGVINYNNSRYTISGIYGSDKFVVIDLSRTSALSVRKIADRIIKLDMGFYPIVVQSIADYAYRYFTFNVKNMTLHPSSFIEFYNYYY